VTETDLELGDGRTLHVYDTVPVSRVSLACLYYAINKAERYKIHILAMAYIFVAALLAIVSRRGYESGRNKLARRRDLVGFFAFGLSFVAFNVALIAAAAIAG